MTTNSSTQNLRDDERVIKNTPSPRINRKRENRVWYAEYLADQDEEGGDE